MLLPTPELAAGDALYTAAIAMSISADPAAPDPVGDVYAAAAALIAIVERARDAYFADADTPALMTIALVHVADLSDVLASRLANVANPFPPGSNDARNFRDGFHEIVEGAGFVRSLFCDASYYYGLVLVRDPLNDRARGQIDGYGGAFVEDCAARAEP